MTTRTPKQQEETRRSIWISPVETDSDWPVWATSNQWTDGIEYVPAAALSSRDREIREVLEGLRDDDCFDACFLRWMKRYEDSDGFDHSPACLAARGLWERVQGLKTEHEDGDTQPMP